MKSFLPSAGVAFLAAVATYAPAHAQSGARTGPSYGPDGIYVAAAAGYVLLEDVSGTVNGVPFEGEYQGGDGVSGAVGYRSGPFRAELELGFLGVGYRRFTVGGTRFDVDGDVKVYTVTANAFYDLDTGMGLTPYVGAGIGLAHSSVDQVIISLGGGSQVVEGNEGTDLTAFGEVGVTYAITPNVHVGPAYRYVWLDNGSGGLDDDTAHIFKLAVRYTF